MSAAESVDPAVQAALEALAAGISVLPIVLDGTKSPAVAKWTHWQHKPMGEDEARHRFCGRAIGIIGGRVSGGLEIIDIETRDGLDKGRRAAEEMGVGNIFDRVVAGYTVRTTRGWHVAFRSDSSEPARKLAHCDVTRCQHEPRHEGAKNLLVETRGEGSYAEILADAQAIGYAEPDPTMDVSGRDAAQKLAEGGLSQRSDHWKDR